MGWQNLAHRRPPGASCNWTKEELAAGAPYRWWRPATGQSCAISMLQISAVGLTVFPNGQGIVVPPPSPSWWVGNAGGYYDGSGIVSCGLAVNGYFMGGTGRIVQIDVMGALRDAVWSSSVSFNVYITQSSSVDFEVSPVSGKPYSLQVINSFASASSCANAISVGLLKVVTVYDDGRITIT